MPKFTDSLRGYGYPIHKRDHFECQYCGFDGSKWPNWLSLSVDHLLPQDHSNREEEEFKVTACMFCNTADNMYFLHAMKRGLRFDGLSPSELVQQRRPYVEKIRAEYERFWKAEVKMGK